LRSSKLKQREDKLWRIKITDLATGIKKKGIYQIVFIGAGGGSLPC
jgi:malate dehydrogenase (quinone)